jgi:arabinogalactan oligomer/maltooligosaccharide transport system permease protein
METTMAKKIVKIPSRKQVLIASILFMGLGHILFLKQYIKGFLFAFIQIIILFFSPMIRYILIDLTTLGFPQPDIPVRLRANSLFMLVDGVILMAILVIFVVAYIISIRSALSDYKDLIRDGAQKTNKKFIRDLSGKSFPMLALAPSLGLLLFFVVVPLVFSVAVAFTNYSSPNNIPPGNTIDWVGLDNFRTLFGGGQAWTASLGAVAAWTVIWAFLATTTTYFGGMLMAVVLKENKIKIAPVLRSIFILPYAVPAIITMLIWAQMLNGEFGVINNTLRAVGLLDGTIPWLSNMHLARMMIVLLNLWAGFPYFMLLVTGTMTSISNDVYEAARIDGAGGIQLFRRITFPLVTYQTMPLIIMSFAFNFNNFGAIFFLFQGQGPTLADTVTTSARATDIMITWIFKLTDNLNQFHMASTLAVMIFVLLAPFAIFNFMRTKSYREGDL